MTKTKKESCVSPLAGNILPEGCRISKWDWLVKAMSKTKPGKSVKVPIPPEIAADGTAAKVRFAGAVRQVAQDRLWRLAGISCRVAASRIQLDDGHVLVIRNEE